MAKKGSSSHLSKLPEKVRTSRLVKALDRVVADDATSGFDYFARLGDLVDLITPQLEWIPRLFPEYTPHTFEGHIVRLFRIADEVLGPKVYARLNAMELFLFTTGLFAHDWGMAVGGAEQKALQAGAKGETFGEAFILLPNERALLEDFARERALPMNEDGSIPRLIDAELGEYIRRTHAWRSAVRIRHFLSDFDPAVAEAAAFVCEGHWLELREIRRRHDKRSVDILLHSEVPLGAIAIYVRTVDLFDLARDRTPPKLESFVGPISSRSQIEWAKHRALSPVKAHSRGGRRQLIFQGTVEDPAVWAALQDQSRWVDEQFRNGLQFLLHHLPDYLPSDLDSHIEWDLKPNGFKPIDIRFEFNRRRVFQLLGEELYGEDPYVFLRELLQNAIDATRIRRACQQNEEPTQKYEPSIHFGIVHGEGGDVKVCCSDNGIGLDEYVVRHYLAAVGASYQDSADFRRLGAKVDLIARYGIGFLSCFTVADVVTLRTRRYAPPGQRSDALRIVIDGVENQFSVFDDAEYAGFGTEVTVHVIGRKFPASTGMRRFGGERLVPLRVAEYISRLAGFVEVPVTIDERSRRTLVINSETDATTIGGQLEPTTTVAQLGRESVLRRWSEETKESSIGEVISIQAISLRDQLQLTTCEGSMYFPILQEGCVWLLNMDYDEGEMRPAAVKPQKKHSFGFVPWRDKGNRVSRGGRHLVSPGSENQRTLIFSDGIRVPGGAIRLSSLFGLGAMPLRN